MKYRFAFVLGVVLSSMPALAHVSPSHGAPPSAPPTFEDFQESQRLFLSLTPEQSFLSPKSLEFRIRLDGKPYLTEALTLPTLFPGQASTFEVLAQMPSIRETLHRLTKEGHRIRVQSFLDGAKVQDLLFQELVRQQSLATGSEVPLPGARSELRLYERGILPEPANQGGMRSITASGLDPVCVSNCEYQLELCVDNDCGGDYCEECDLERQSCLDRCGCTNPKNVYTYTTSSTSSQVVGTGCLFVMKYQHAHWHSQRKYQPTTTTWQVTESCDGTSSVIPISTSYGTPVYCYEDSQIDCSPDVGTATSCHY